VASDMMKLVKMREVGDCGPACLATVTGDNLDDIIAWARELERPDSWGTSALNDPAMLEYLRTHGYPDAQQVTNNPNPPAILVVPSLNIPGLLHYVVWSDERTVLDPSLGPRLWPGDAPVVNGKQVNVQWATAIECGGRRGK